MKLQLARQPLTEFAQVSLVYHEFFFYFVQHVPRVQLEAIHLHLVPSLPILNVLLVIQLAPLALVPLIVIAPRAPRVIS